MRYTYQLTFKAPEYKGYWQILDMTVKGWQFHNPNALVAEYPYHKKDDDGTGRPPAAVRQRYEELLGRGEFDGPLDQVPNVVEMVAGRDDCAFDQPCAHGHRVEDHAIYCHNDRWLYAPRKCRRSARQQRKCPGFKARELETPPTGSTFTLTNGDCVTRPLRYDATPEEIQEALDAS